MRKKIIVTRNDIELGERGNSSECPIIIALECVTTIRPIRVDEGQVRIFENASPEFDAEGVEDEDIPDSSIKLPKSVQKWLAQYDAGKKVKPISFYVDLPY